MYYEILETPEKMTAFEASAKYPNKDIYIKYEIDYLRTLGDFDEPVGEVIALEDFNVPIKVHRELWNYIQGLESDKYDIRQIHGDNCYDEYTHYFKYATYIKSIRTGPLTEEEIDALLPDDYKDDHND